MILSHEKIEEIAATVTKDFIRLRYRDEYIALSKFFEGRAAV